MKNKTYTLPQYFYLKDSRHSKDYHFELPSIDGPLWAMKEISVSGTEENGWIIVYDRSWKVWKLYHPQIYLYTTLTETKEIAQEIARLISPQEYGFYFSERGFICSNSTWEELSKEIKERIPGINNKGQRFNSTYGHGLLTVWSK